MTCSEFRTDVVAYHFGEVSGEQRRCIEEHLLSCDACLREFLSLKRSIETADESDAPSQKAQDALRLAVEELVAPPSARPWSWWERPTAFVCAGVAVAFALAFVQLH